MGTVRRARRFAVAALYGTASVAGVGMAVTGLLVGQAMVARRAIPFADSPPPECDGVYGTARPAKVLRLAVLGDSSAAGYGVEAPRHTFGALLATGLAEQLCRPVELRCLAVVGAQSRHLREQVERALAGPPELAVILIGGNDVTHRAELPTAVRELGDAVRALRAAGTEVVVGTCPDLGTVRPFPPPLRWLARRWSRQLATGQTVAVVAAGGRTVSLGDLLGPAFAAEPDRMFGEDRFHPSADGYLATAAALIPTAVAALTEPAPLAETAAVHPSVHTDEGVRTLSRAAVEAAARSGTEVSPGPTAIAGRQPVGGWAQLRHRAWRYVGRPADPTHVPLPVQSPPEGRIRPGCDDRADRDDRAGQNVRDDRAGQSGS